MKSIRVYRWSGIVVFFGLSGFIVFQMITASKSPLGFLEELTPGLVVLAGCVVYALIKTVGKKEVPVTPHAPSRWDGSRWISSNGEFYWDGKIWQPLPKV